MIDEFKKSVNSVLYERVSSPLFGAFIFSWCIYNWKIIYLTLFVSESKLTENKIDYITNNFFELKNLLWLPLLATAIIILIYPFLAVGAFYVTSKFKQWKIGIRNDIEKKQTLTIAESIELRSEIRKQEDNFDNLLKDKIQEIETLKANINEYEKQLLSLNQSVSTLPNKEKENIYKTDFEELKSNSKLFTQFEKVAPRAQREIRMFSESSGIDRKVFDYFLANDIVEKSGVTGVYKFTEKGKIFNRMRLDDQYNNN